MAVKCNDRVGFGFVGCVALVILTSIICMVDLVSSMEYFYVSLKSSYGSIMTTLGFLVSSRSMVYTPRGMLPDVLSSIYYCASRSSRFIVIYFTLCLCNPWHFFLVRVVKIIASCWSAAVFISSNPLKVPPEMV